MQSLYLLNTSYINVMYIIPLESKVRFSYEKHEL